jgi:hypothetical protein
MTARQCTNGRNGHAGPRRLTNRGNRATAPPAPAAPAERDAAGRFQPGCRPGPGNPHFRRVAALRHELLAAVEAEGAVRRLVAALVKRVERRGDLQAAALLLKYALGGPLKAADPDSADADELERSRGAHLPELLDTDTVSVPAALALLHGMQKLGLQLAASTAPVGALLGAGGWAKIFTELNDPQLIEWWRELCAMQREAQRAASRQAGNADAAGGAAGKKAMP